MPAREDRYAVPGTLALPNCAIAEGPKSMRGKRPLLGVELLQADDICSVRAIQARRLPSRLFTLLML